MPQKPLFPGRKHKTQLPPDAETLRRYGAGDNPLLARNREEAAKPAACRDGLVGGIVAARREQAVIGEPA
ncbi:MAG TPA: hypothetical protein HPP50_07740, partial [Rhodospirillaceae bacterium]|nr:hypothetical protein [Rhodospirillaceae bacterium]